MLTLDHFHQSCRNLSDLPPWWLSRWSSNNYDTLVVKFSEVFIQVRLEEVRSVERPKSHNYTTRVFIVYFIHLHILHFRPSNVLHCNTKAAYTLCAFQPSQTKEKRCVRNLPIALASALKWWSCVRLRQVQGQPLPMVFWPTLASDKILTAKKYLTNRIN